MFGNPYEVEVRPSRKNRADRAKFREIRDACLRIPGLLDTPCWVPTKGSLRSSWRVGDYFCFRYLGKKWRVHKWMLVYKLGRMLEPREVARHLCHRRTCCRPSHLAVGYHAQNAQDRRARKSQEKAAADGKPLSAREIERTSLVHAPVQGSAGKLQMGNGPAAAPSPEAADLLSQIETRGYVADPPRHPRRPKPSSRPSRKRHGESRGFLSLPDVADTLDEDFIETGGDSSRLRPTVSYPTEYAEAMAVLQSRGWTLAEISRAFRVPDRTVSRIVRGKLKLY